MKLTKKLWILAAILIISGTSVLTSCSKDDDIIDAKPQQKEYFTLWNQCEALTVLQDYVKDVTNPSSPNFIKAEDRIATFMLVADDDARDHADLAEGARREAKWREAGYIVISMKNDFKTIYGDGVEKVDFSFNEWL